MQLEVVTLGKIITNLSIQLSLHLSSMVSGHFFVARLQYTR